MTYTVKINALRLRAFHGVLPQERRVGNDFEVDVELRYPFGKALESDCVDDTLNYAAAVDIVKREMAKPSLLLEHVAGRIREALLEAFPAIEGGRVEVRKLTPPVTAQMAYAGVSIEW